MDSKVVIAYGFEYDKLIKYTKNIIICKSIKNLPFVILLKRTRIV